MVANEGVKKTRRCAYRARGQRDAVFRGLMPRVAPISSVLATSQRGGDKTAERSVGLTRCVSLRKDRAVTHRNVFVEKMFKLFVVVGETCRWPRVEECTDWEQDKQRKRCGRGQEERNLSTPQPEKQKSVSDKCSQ